MTNEQLNTALYEKMFAEQETYRAWLLSNLNKLYAKNLDPEHEEKEIPIFEKTKKWLDIYFSGREPNFMPPLHMLGSPFQLSVWKILREIPYGQTTTYGEIAKRIAAEKGISRSQHRQSAALWGIIRFPLLFRATVL